MGIVSWTRGDGPLVSFARGFREELIRLGFTPSVVAHYAILMGQLNRWRCRQELVVGDLTQSKAEEFLASFQTDGQRRVPTMAILGRLLGDLRMLQAAPPEEFEAPTPATN
jgi:hypothetical protein